MLASGMQNIHLSHALYRDTESDSQNSWDWKITGDHKGNPTASLRVTQSRLPSSTSRQVWKSAGEMHFWTACARALPPSQWRICFSRADGASRVPVWASCPVAVHHRKQPSSILLIIPLRYLCTLIRSPLCLLLVTLGRLCPPGSLSAQERS